MKNHTKISIRIGNSVVDGVLYDNEAARTFASMLPLIGGSKAVSLWQTKLGYELSNGPKELFIVEGAGHFDLYDNPKYIEQVLTKMISFFNHHLHLSE